MYKVVEIFWSQVVQGLFWYVVGRNKNCWTFQQQLSVNKHFLFMDFEDNMYPIWSYYSNSILGNWKAANSELRLELCHSNLRSQRLIVIERVCVREIIFIKTWQSPERDWVLNHTIWEQTHASFYWQIIPHLQYSVSCWALFVNMLPYIERKKKDFSDMIKLRILR